jgi:hypothetical protein
MTVESNIRLSKEIDWVNKYGDMRVRERLDGFSTTSWPLRSFARQSKAQASVDNPRGANLLALSPIGWHGHFGPV